MNIGIIGLGDMGLLYAKTFRKAGYAIFGSDPSQFRDQLEAELQPLGITVLDDGKEVSRRCDIIFYAVEAEKISQVVQLYGPSTKYGAIVADKHLLSIRKLQPLRNIYLLT